MDRMLIWVAPTTFLLVFVFGGVLPIAGPGYTVFILTWPSWIDGFMSCIHFTSVVTFSAKIHNTNVFEEI